MLKFCVRSLQCQCSVTVRGNAGKTSFGGNFPTSSGHRSLGEFASSLSPVFIFCT